VTTDKLITGSRRTARAGSQVGKQQLGAIPLSWSAAVRVNNDIIIQATIECVVLFLCLPFNNRILSLGLDEAVRLFLN
jgi:hypothetical protein